jgi:SAM-dependent methyltransferase
LEAAVRDRIDALIEEGVVLFSEFDRSVREKSFHPFVAADYNVVLETLLSLRASRQSDAPTFIELGSGHGVITIMADLLGFDAVGIELDGSLVAIARGLAKRYESKARFAVGSFLPSGYRWKSETGDSRMGTLGSGPSAYLELGRALDDFEIVYAYPWEGEAPIIRDLARRYADPRARLILMDAVEGVEVTDAGGAASRPSKRAP